MATVNYSWTLPTVGASVNTWGTLLNTIIDDIDAKMVSKTGTQTLTNKTLAAPTFTGGITVSSGGASITGNTSVTGTLGVSSTLSTTSGSAVRLYRPDNATYTDISMAAGASGGLIFNNANSDGFTFKNAGSTVAQFSSTGLAVTGSVSATGINFPTTQNPSPDPNTLDDYEEGTWTPTFRGSSTAGSYTISVNTSGATYTKVGRLVTVNGAFTITAVGSAGTGYAQVTGMPFVNSGQTSGSCYFQNVDLDAGCLWCDAGFISDTGVTIIYFNTIRDNAVSIDTQISGFGSSSYIRFSLTYTTST